MRGYPNELRVDNGPENISSVMSNWAANNGVIIKFIQPGKPAQNGYIERFNRTYREEILNMNLFYDIDHAQAITDEWLIKYNGERPHESLGDLIHVNSVRNYDCLLTLCTKNGRLTFSCWEK